MIDLYGKRHGVVRGELRRQHAFVLAELFEPRLRVVPDDFKLIVVQKEVDKAADIYAVARLDLVVANERQLFQIGLLFLDNWQFKGPITIFLS